MYAGPPLPHIQADYSDMHRDTQTQRHARTDACTRVSSHADTLTRRHTRSVLLGAGALCLSPEGPCHRPEWTPCPPTEHDSFRRIVPQACLVPAPATSAGQVVRRVPAWAERVPGRLPTRSQLGPEGSPRQQPLGSEWRFHAAAPGGRPSCAPAGPGMGQACRHPPPPLTPAGPTLAHPSFPRADRAGPLLDLTVGVRVGVYPGLSGWSTRRGGPGVATAT